MSNKDKMTEITGLGIKLLNSIEALHRCMAINISDQRSMYQIIKDIRLPEISGLAQDLRNRYSDLLSQKYLLDVILEDCVKQSDQTINFIKELTGMTDLPADTTDDPWAFLTDYRNALLALDDWLKKNPESDLKVFLDRDDSVKINQLHALRENLDSIKKSQRDFQAQHPGKSIKFDDPKQSDQAAKIVLGLWHQN